MEDLQKATTKEIFEELKNRIEVNSEDSLNTIEHNLLYNIFKSKDTGQELLLEKMKFLYENLEKEKELLTMGVKHFINKDDLNQIIDQLSKINDKNILFVELEYYPRVIPQDVLEKLKEVKSRNLFDKYYILYTDFTYKGEKITSGTVEKTEKTKEKDPILFGAFVKNSSTLKNTKFMGDKLYVIADWEDEYCDLTLDKLMEQMPNVVHEIDKQDIQKYLEDAFSNEVTTELEEKPKKLTFFERIKVLFKGQLA